MMVIAVLVLVAAVLVTGAAIEHIAAVAGVSWVTVVAAMWLVAVSVGGHVRRR